MTVAAPIRDDGSSLGLVMVNAAELVWESHPARRRPRRLAAVLAVVLAVSVLCAWVGRSPLWGIFAAFVLVFSLDGFLFPTRFVLRDDGVSVKRTFSRSERPWSTFRRVYRDRHGLTLSPYTRRTALEPYRSLRLLYDGGDPTAIDAGVRSRLAPEVEWIEVAAR
ncbi:MAG: hypothetical protein R3E12_17585 [Candidatus Eisenbacteria bacterium]|uniref:PH domain-containing protein n=1 Tax=Eiseniibacteriota bacterium TaxID=2212470 RepID=A0A956RPV5_UNCEI|nr:hypothetical protein [Candidatus Eisenbacteria bacterium]